jgi:hypothetical protein
MMVNSDQRIVRSQLGRDDAVLMVDLGGCEIYTQYRRPTLEDGGRVGSGTEASSSDHGYILGRR